ncbi:LuxR C-terminal-related transcriptional regulator [Actinoallomurus sp. NBC_01490]|uniref:helix-turn-helix transcriptional regulator n=1 Tax=Actinoallomurus sp. NBC_01490 TaxID=2903557 RepID=UPI002E30C847|nr:LuxR C-terminal-related transcriptional regulator [Actinoallomurus sp. NBC_01490]
MSSWEPGGVQRLFEGLVRDDVLAVFEKLVAADGCPASEAEQFVGGPEMLQELLDCGMAHVGSDSPNPPHFVPAPPEMALQGVLRKRQHQLLADCELLMDGHGRFSRIDRTRPQSGEFRHRLVEIVTDRAEITRLSHALVNVAQDDWMSLENARLETPLDEATGYSPPPAFEQSLRCRAIYEASLLDNTIGRRTVEEAIRHGEEARLLPRIGMKLKLADESVAMLPLTPTGMEGAMVIRSAVVAGALREYFELLWERAMPVGTRPESSTGLPPVEERILPLLAQGLTDEAIANRLKVSLPTVQRRLANLKKRLAVDTRIAIVVAAMRRGWIQ